MLIAADGHLHWYPFYDPKAAFRALFTNLDVLAAERSPANTPVLRIGCMMERAGYSFFDQIRTGRFDCSAAGFGIAPCADGTSVLFTQGDKPGLCMVPCRQAATAERLEVLGMGMTDLMPDGLSARDAIRRVTECGGVPVIPWGAGKWLFGRGHLVMNLLESADPNCLLVGDSSLRPRLFSDPAPIKLAIRRGFTILPGSDPLPLPDEETVMGSCGFTCETPFDLDRPMDSLRNLLTSGRAGIRPAGRRNGPLRAARRLVRMNIFKRFCGMGLSPERREE